MSQLAKARFPTGVVLFGHTMSTLLEVTVVVIFALIFFGLAIWGLSRTD
jgi:hypothetical protein